MFKALKWIGSSRKREKYEFRFQFHVTGVPQVGFDRLLVSVIPVDAGKASRKTSKVHVKHGTCEWNETLTERVKFYKDKKTNLWGERPYKFVVSTGSSFRSGTLGEAVLNLVEFLKFSQVNQKSIVLKNCAAGSILHITTQCVMLRPAGSKEEDEVSQGTGEDDAEAFDSAPEDLESDHSETCSGQSTVVQSAHGALDRRHNVNRRRSIAGSEAAEARRTPSQTTTPSPSRFLRPCEDTPDRARRSDDQRSSWEPNSPFFDHGESGGRSPLPQEDPGGRASLMDDRLSHGELEVMAEARLEAARAECLSWQERSEKLSGEVDLVRQQLTYANASHLVQISAVQMAHDDLKKEVVNLREENEELGMLRDDVGRMDSRNKELQQYVSSVEERYDDLVELYRNLEETNRELKEKLDEEEAMQESLEEDMAIAKQGMNHEEQMRELRMQLLNSENEKRGLEILLKEAEEQNSKISSESQSMRSDGQGEVIADLEQKVKELEAEATELTYENMEQAARLTRTLNDLAERERVIVELRASVRRLEDRKSEMQVPSLESHRKEIDVLKRRVAELTDEAEEGARAMDRCKAEDDSKMKKMALDFERRLGEAQEAQRLAESASQSLRLELEMMKRIVEEEKLLRETVEAKTRNVCENGLGDSCETDRIANLLREQDEMKVELKELGILNERIAEELHAMEEEEKNQAAERDALLSSVRSADRKMTESGEDVKQLQEMVRKLESEILKKEEAEEGLKNNLRNQAEGLKEMEEQKDALIATLKDLGQRLREAVEGRVHAEDKLNGQERETEEEAKRMAVSSAALANACVQDLTDEIASLAKAVSQKDMEVVQLREKNSDLKRICQEMEMSTMTLNGRLRELNVALEEEKEKVEAGARSHADMLQRRQVLEAENRMLESRYIKAELEFATALHSIEGRLQAVQEESSSAVRTRDAALTRIKQLEESACKLEMKLSMSEQEKQTTLSNIAATNKDQVSKLENEIASCMRENKELRLRLSGSEVFIKSLEMEKKRLEEESRRAAEEATEHARDLAMLKHGAHEDKCLAEMEIESLHHNLELMRKELSERGAREDELESRNGELRSMKLSLSEKLLAAERDLAMSQDRIAKSESELATLRKESDERTEKERQRDEDWRSELGSLRGQMLAMEERVRLAEEALGKAEGEKVIAVERLQSEVQRLTEQLSAGNDQKQELASHALVEASELRAENGVLQDQIRRLEGEVVAAKSEMERIVKASEVRVQSLEGALTLEKRAGAERESRTKQLEAYAADLAEREVSTAQILGDLRMEKENLIDRMGDLESKNNALMEVKDMVEEARKELFEKLQQKERDIEAARGENRSLAAKLRNVEKEAIEMQDIQNAVHTELANSNRQLEDELRVLQAENAQRRVQEELPLSTTVEKQQHHKWTDQKNGLERLDVQQEIDTPGRCSPQNVTALRQRVKLLEDELHSRSEMMALLEKKVQEDSRYAASDVTVSDGSQQPESPSPINGDLEASSELSALHLKIQLLESELRIKAAAMKLSHDETKEQERNFIEEVRHLQTLNEQLASHKSTGDESNLALEVIRLQNQNADLARKEKDMAFRLNAQGVLEKEVERLQETCKNLAAQSEEELKHLRYKYMDLSIQFAEVEAEREQLVQTVKQLRRKK